MAKDQSKRLKPSIIAADEDSFGAAQTFTDYNPANPDFTITSLTTARTEMVNAQNAEAQAAAALDAARDVSVDKEWTFHNKVVGMRDSVAAQYGRDSNQVQSVGRKKESERKAPRRKTDQSQT
jgi:hypothetical protein